MPRRWPSVIGLAAAAVLVAGAAVMLARARTAAPPVTEPKSAPAMRELVASRGERAIVRLADGSVVTLGPATRLRVPASYSAGANGGARDVYLEGEVYFEVAHDSTRPFRVHTADGIAEDLGTTFVVTAYPETRGTRVVVTSGQVALRPAGLAGPTEAAPVLQPGDLGRIDTSGAVALRRGVDTAAYVGWRAGVLGFDQAPIREALARIGRWYDLDFRLPGAALDGKRLTATFRNEPVAWVLRTLEVALDVRARQRGRAVLLEPTTPDSPRDSLR